MFPILYESITVGTVPQNFGLGVLTDCIACEVEESRNGGYELVLEYPANGIHAKDFAYRRIIKAKPNMTDDPQLFRIDRIGKEMKGKFTVYAKHISYDLSGYVITSGSAINVVQACSVLNGAASGYVIDTSKETVADFTISAPSSVRSWFGGKEGSLLDVYGGGEWKYDNFHCKLWANRGVDAEHIRTSIRYGKNLLELSQDKDCSNLYSHVLCYYKNEDGVEVVSSQVATGLTLDVPKTFVLDVTSEYNEVPTQSQLDTRAQQYISEHNLTTPSDNITLNFVQSGELKDRVDLCDVVNVYYEALGINVQMKCIRTRYDCLREKYIEAEFGDVRKDLADTVIGNSVEIAANKSDIYNTAVNARAYTDAIKATLDGEIDDLQDQIDGNITTWYYNYAPTTSNLPASEWTTDEEKQKHSGDLFYDNTTQFCYRWTYQNNAWTWVLIQDTGIAQALAAAQAAQDTADNKRRIFISTPVPPYDEGDLWIDGNDIQYCTNAKPAGDTYEESDWLLASAYVDKSELELAIQEVAQLITGGLGGTIIIMRNETTGKPYEIVIANSENIHANTTKVWRWNINGLAYSDQGYDSPEYFPAITADGKIVANRILTGTLDASAITVRNLTANMFVGQEIDLGGANNSNGVLKILDRSNNVLVQMTGDGVECFGEPVNGITPSVVFDKHGVTGYSNSADKENSAIFWTNKDEFHMKNAVVENELSVGGKFKLVPFTIRNSNNEIINDGIAEVPID